MGWTKNLKKIWFTTRLKARTESIGEVRKFKVPKINFNAKDYNDMISWPENDVSEPLLLRYIFSDSLKEFKRKTSESEPNRNVGCETVTESTLNVCGSIAKEGYIWAKIKSSMNMPKFITKNNLMWHWSRNEHFAAVAFAINNDTRVKNTKLVLQNILLLLLYFEINIFFYNSNAYICI